jgi:DNA-binding XRE family transcriptional regulator
MAKSFNELEDRARAKYGPGWDEDVAVIKQAIEDALELAELRRRRGVTQVQLADRLGISQGNVSHLERRNELYLSTLRDYVEALGGRLELAAVFPDEPEPLPLRVGERSGS